MIYCRNLKKSNVEDSNMAERLAGLQALHNFHKLYRFTPFPYPHCKVKINDYKTDFLLDMKQIRRTISTITEH